MIDDLISHPYLRQVLAVAGEVATAIVCFKCEIETDCPPEVFVRELIVLTMSLEHLAPKKATLRRVLSDLLCARGRCNRLATRGFELGAAYYLLELWEILELYLWSDGLDQIWDAIRVRFLTEQEIYSAAPQDYVEKVLRDYFGHEPSADELLALRGPPGGIRGPDGGRLDWLGLRELFRECLSKWEGGHIRAELYWELAEAERLYVSGEVTAPVASPSTATVTVGEEPADSEPSGVPQEERSDSEPSGVLPEMLTATDLALYLGQPVKRVETFLRRFRAKYPDCCREAESPRKNEARYLYRTADVLGPLQEQLSKWQQLTDE